MLNVLSTEDELKRPCFYVFQERRTRHFNLVIKGVRAGKAEPSYTVILRPWAQLFKGQLALNPGLNLKRVFFSCVQKHFLR